MIHRSACMLMLSTWSVLDVGVKSCCSEMSGLTPAAVEVSQKCFFDRQRGNMAHMFCYLLDWIQYLRREVSERLKLVVQKRIQMQGIWGIIKQALITQSWFQSNKTDGQQKPKEAKSKRKGEIQKLNEERASISRGTQAGTQATNVRELAARRGKHMD